MTETVDTVVMDLIHDLGHAGITQMVADGDRLRFCPRSAMTPQLAERVRANKCPLLAAFSSGMAIGDVINCPGGASETSASSLSCGPTAEFPGPAEMGRSKSDGVPKPQTTTVNDADWPGDGVDPGAPCARCGSLDKWWDAVGGEHCQACDRRGMTRSQWLARRAILLRGRCRGW